MKRFLLWICAAALTASSATAAADGTLQKLGANSPYAGIPGLKQEVKGKMPEILKVKKQRVATNNSRLKMAANSVVFTSAAMQKAAPTDPDYMPEIYGSVVYSASESLEFPALYALPTSAGGDFVFTANSADATYGGVAVDGIYYAHEYMDFFGIIQIVTINAFDIESGELLASWNGDVSELATDLAYNPVDKKVYGIFRVYDENENVITTLGTVTYPSIDDASGSVAVEYTVPISGNASWNALAIDKDGKFYGISKTQRTATVEGETVAYTQNSRLYTIDPKTGATTACGAGGATTGEKPYYASSATFDLASNRMFWTVSSREYSAANGLVEEGALCEVNTKTGKAVRLVTYPDGEEICGIFTTAPKSPDAPAAATDFVADYAPGSLTGTISFKLPSKLFGGADATGKFDYVLTANKEEIAKGSGDPGQLITIEKTFEKSGNVKFAVVVSNEAGKSAPAGSTIFVGFAAAEKPGNVVAVETEVGKVSMTWDAVTLDINGITLPKVTYTVTTLNGNQVGEILAEGISETSFAYQAVAAGQPQEILQLAVFAEGDGGIGSGAISNAIFVGEPYTSFKETFANGSISHDFLLNTNAGQGSWGLFTDESGVIDQNGDNGFIGHTGRYLDDSSSLISGKISLKDVKEPVFTFYVYTLVDSESGAAQADIIDVAVCEAGKEFTSVFNKPVADISSEEGWHKASIDLSAYAGKTIQIQVTGVVKMFANLLLDNFYVGQKINKDMSATRVNAPVKAKAGENFAVSVNLLNEGSVDAPAHKLNLYVDDALVETKDVDAVAAGKSTVVSYSVPMHVLAEAPVAIHAEVVLEGDEDASNNTTAKVSVSPVVSNLPAVIDLEAKAEGKTATLTWSEPEVSTAAAGVVDFEDAESFAQNYGEWTFVDGDKNAVGGFQGLDIPGIVSGSTAASFFVFDASGDEFNQSFAGHSGDKYLAALFNINGAQCDDWAISPELSGNAQTISFWAQSYSDSYPESFEVMYSTTTTAVSEFKSAGLKVSAVPGEWTEYKAELPAGAKYFAIHYDAADTFMFMLDDFTFDAKPAVPPTLMGFNVYRDGVKLNAAPVEEGFYTENLEDGKYTYAVTAIYDKGESKGSNRAEIQIGTSGIEDATTVGVSIAAADKAIEICGAEGMAVTVSAIDGKTIFAGEGKAAISVPVAQGIYVVKAGETVAKVIVR